MKLYELLNKKRTIIISFVILIAFVSSFFLLLSGVQNEKLAEKFADMQTRLELITYQTEGLIERDDDFEIFREFYIDSLVYSMQFVDGQRSTFAAVYDKSLINVSARHATYEGSPFDPLAFPEFVEAVRNNDNGILTVEWGDVNKEIPMRKIYICYRWAFENVNEPNLMVIGISKYSLASPSLDFVIIITFIIFFATFVLLLGSVIHIVRDLYIRYGSLK